MNRVRFKRKHDLERATIVGHETWPTMNRVRFKRKHNLERPTLVGHETWPTMNRVRFERKHDLERPTLVGHGLQSLQRLRKKSFGHNNGRRDRKVIGGSRRRKAINRLRRDDLGN